MRSWLSNKTNLLILAVLGVSAAPFLRLLSADFIYWDDHDLLTAAPPVLNFDWRNFLFNLKVGGLFPLTLLSLAVQNQIHGLDPFYYHLANILLHLANGFLVYLCARKIFGLGEGTAIAACLIFLVHPLRVEPVAWISGGRKDLLCAFFFLSALLVYRRSYMGSLLLGTLALLSKAMAVSLPFAVLLTYPLKKERLGAKDLLKLLPFAALSLVAIILEMKGQRTGEVLAESGSLLGGLTNGLTAVVFSFARSFAPNALAIFYEPGAFHFTPFDYAGMLLVVAFLGALAFFRYPNWFVLVLFFALAFPVLKFVPFGKASVFNDRYLYLPGLALSVFFADGMKFLTKKDIVFVLIAPLMFLSYVQSATWKNQETVWLNVLEHYPETRKAYQNLSLYYIENRMLDKGLEYTLKSVAMDPNDMSTKANLGVLYSRMKRYAEAERTLLEVLRVEPKNAVAHHNLAFVYELAGYREQALAHYHEAVRIDPAFKEPAQELERLSQGAAAASPGGIKTGSPAKK